MARMTLDPRRTMKTFKTLLAVLCACASLPAQHRDAIDHLRRREAAYSLRFGDLHIHTSYSADAVVWISRQPPSTGPRFRNPAWSLAWCRDVERLDFACVTDHAEWLNDFTWSRTIDMANAANDPQGRRGRPFVALIGYEWSSTNVVVGTRRRRGYGHRNVIFRNHRVTPEPYDSLNNGQSIDTSRPDLLWAALDAFKTIWPDYDYVTIPHTSADARGDPKGPLFFSMATDWDYVDPVRQPAVEIYSKHGSSEGADGREFHDPGAGRYDWWVRHAFQPIAGIERNQDRTVQAALQRWLHTGNEGYMLGILASTDTHNAKGGKVDEVPVTDPDFFLLDNGGLCGAFVAKFSREGVFDAIRARRLIGTSGPRTHLAVAVLCSDGARAFMGERARTRGVPILAIHAEPRDGIRRLEIVRNGRKLATLPVRPGQRFYTYEDRDFPGRAYYYVRALTEPRIQYWAKKAGLVVNRKGAYLERERVWSSPVWLEPPAEERDR